MKKILTLVGILLVFALIFGCTSPVQYGVDIPQNSTPNNATNSGTVTNITNPTDNNFGTTAKDRPNGEPLNYSAQIQNYSFYPETITINVGDSVSWTNDDSTQHTVTSDLGLFDSGLLPKGQSFKHTFSEPGTYTYHCNIHPGMKGTIIVVW